MKSERKAEDIKAIYDFVSKDYKGITDNEYCILYLCPNTGGTTSGPIKYIPQKIYNYYLNLIKKR